MIKGKEIPLFAREFWRKEFLFFCFMDLFLSCFRLENKNKQLTLLHLLLVVFWPIRDLNYWYERRIGIQHEKIFSPEPSNKSIIFDSYNCMKHQELGIGRPWPTK